MERIGDGVERELARTGGGAGLALAEITTAWPDAVGEAVARHAWPLRIARDGTLHVATSSSTWACELDRMAGEVGERLASALGKEAPPKLRFAPGNLPEPDRPADVIEEVVAPSPEVVVEADTAASVIEDEELRELVARAARASLQRARSDRDF